MTQIREHTVLNPSSLQSLSERKEEQKKQLRIEIINHCNQALIDGYCGIRTHYKDVIFMHIPSYYLLTIDEGREIFISVLDEYRKEYWYIKTTAIQYNFFERYCLGKKNHYLTTFKDIFN